MQETKHPVYCNGKDCLDQILLDELMDIFPKIKQNTLIVLHAQGSHGPAYYKRYPDKFKKFLPTCDTSDIKDCSLDQIVNAYDNTILYTDYIISQAIDIAKKYPKLESSVIYVSDHGESLGENNIFLHGMPFGIAPDEQKSVPMLIWMNENMKKWDHIDYNCLKLSAEKNAYSHDNLFHSLLGLMAIKTSAYDKRYDLFDACRTKPLPYIGK
jgi:lipid A ethanolaminephosphotransferase